MASFQLEVLQAWLPWNFRNSWSIWGVGISVCLEHDRLLWILNLFTLFQQTGWRLSVHGVCWHHGEGKQEMGHFGLLQKLAWMSCYIITSILGGRGFCGCKCCTNFFVACWLLSKNGWGRTHWWEGLGERGCNLFLNLICILEWVMAGTVSNTSNQIHTWRFQVDYFIVFHLYYKNLPRYLPSLGNK